jgi:hypothetical protein
MMEHEQARVIMALTKLSVAVGEPMTPERFTAYLQFLDDLPADALVWAIEYHGRKNTFFPRPAELRETARTWRPAHRMRLPEPRPVVSDDAPGRVNFKAQLERLRKKCGPVAAE